MATRSTGGSFHARELDARLRTFREVDDVTNLRWLGFEYATLALILLPSIAFCEWRRAAGFHWMWNLPVVAVAAFLIGAVQHRLAGLAHEAAHYTLFRNKLWNEIAADLFCMFPLFATTHQYRLVHQAHHQFTNDWERDPDLLDIGASKLMDRFPMKRGRFLYNYFFRFFLPPVLLRYMWDVIRLSALGQGRNPYCKDLKPTILTWRGVRLTSVLGVLYFAGLAAVLRQINHSCTGAGLWTALAATPLSAWASMTAVVYLLPAEAFFRSPLKCAVSVKTLSWLRLSYYTLFLATVGWLHSLTGIFWGGYVWLFWMAPLFTTFGYYMLLRDVYQHANADAGRLTNTRVFFADRFTHWAVFVYGQDMHVPHHLYPAIPHYHLPAVHALLTEESPEYARHVVECHGTFVNDSGKPTILDVMEFREPSALDPAPAKR